MGKLVNMLLKDSLEDVVRLISRSGKLDWPIRKKEFAQIIPLLDTPNLDQVFDTIYPVVEYVENQRIESIDLSPLIDESIEPDINVWMIEFMNSIIHSILRGHTIRTIKVPAKVDTVVLSIFTRCVEGANRIKNEEPVEIRILPSSSRKEVKE